MKKYKLTIINTHPIQYQAPLFKKIAENQQIDLMVYYCWNFGVAEAGFDPQFGKEIKWDIPVLDGYQYKFLKNYSLKPSSDFWGQINFGIINEIVKNKYDAILIFGWNSFSNWLAFLTAFLTRTPVFLRGDSPLNQEFSKPEWKLKIKKIILGTLFKFISAFLYIGEQNKKFYQFYGIPDKKLFFTPFAVDNERFIKAAQSLKRKKQALRKKMGINKDDIVILFIGKLIEKKRPMELLKAYQRLNNPRLHLLFVGDGNLRPELEEYVKENNLQNVHFIGFKNQTELPEYYTMADVFVLPSGAGETWGLVVNEAMCFGLPIIASDVLGSSFDLAKGGENGYIFQLDNIEELSARLQEIISDKKKIKEFGKRSFEIVQDYNFTKDIEGIFEAFKYIKQ